MKIERPKVSNEIIVDGISGNYFSRLIYYKKGERKFFLRVVSNAKIFGFHLIYFFNHKEWITKEKLINKIITHCKNSSNEQIEKVDVLFKMLIWRIEDPEKRSHFNSLYTEIKIKNGFNIDKKEENLKKQNVTQKIAKLKPISTEEELKELTVEEELKELSKLSVEEELKELSRLSGESLRTELPKRLKRINCEELNPEESVSLYCIIIQCPEIDPMEFLDKLNPQSQIYMYNVLNQQNFDNGNDSDDEVTPSKKEEPKEIKEEKEEEPKFKEEEPKFKEEGLSFEDILGLAEEHYTQEEVSQLENEEACSVFRAFLQGKSQLEEKDQISFEKLLISFSNKLTPNQIKEMVSEFPFLEKPMINYNPVYARERRADLLEKKFRP